MDKGYEVSIISDRINNRIVILIINEITCYAFNFVNQKNIKELQQD